MIILKRNAAVAIVLIAASAASVTIDAGHATGGATSRQTVDFRFEEQRPGVPSGIYLAIDYRDPANPDGKPPAVRTVIEALAPGARIDTSVPERCGASNGELMAQGESACPAGSLLGEGTIKIDTGFPEPGRFIVADVIFINNADELIFLSTVRSNGARVVSRSAIEGRRIVNEAPTLPGTPPDGGALDEVEARLDPIARTIDGVRRGYITTPARCPASGRWTNSIDFTYSDGVMQSADDGSHCAGGADAARRCAKRWSGGPGPDRHVGTRDGDRLLGLGGPDQLRGRHGRDCLIGGAGSDHLRGGQGGDLLRGGGGRDRLAGGPGRDLLRGSRGADSLRARAGGRDSIRCGPGRDEVRAGRRDRVADSCEVVND